MEIMCKRSPLIMICHSVSYINFCVKIYNHSVIFILGDVKSLSPEKSPIAMKDVKWHSHNATVGFLVSGKLSYS